MIGFKRAIKYETKGRIALIGPAGSGKSLTGLKWARALAGPDGKIAAIDTEHGSLSKYADQYEFDVIEPDTFSPEEWLATLKEAEKAGYSVFFTDSLSHYWMGQGGALEWVDNAKKVSRSRDEMSGWKDFAPVERRMIDAMIASPCHVIVTMRTKTEYQDEEYVNSKGERRKKRVKVGLQPVQRQGLEYEFDLIGYMDEGNTFVTDKTRCEFYNGKAITRPSEKDIAPFMAWLKGNPAPPKMAPTSGNVAAVKAAALQQGMTPEEASAAVANVVQMPTAPIPPTSDALLVLVEESIEAVRQKGANMPDKAAFHKAIDDVKAGYVALGMEATYREILGLAGAKNRTDLLKDASKAHGVYKALSRHLADLKARAAQNGGGNAA
jgi:hypothetical protein